VVSGNVYYLEVVAEFGPAGAVRQRAVVGVVEVYARAAVTRTEVENPSTLRTQQDTEPQAPLLPSKEQLMMAARRVALGTNR
jgi:hypothetical protein